MTTNKDRSCDNTQQQMTATERVITGEPESATREVAPRSNTPSEITTKKGVSTWDTNITITNITITKHHAAHGAHGACAARPAPATITSTGVTAADAGAGAASGAVGAEGAGGAEVSPGSGRNGSPTVEPRKLV